MVRTVGIALAAVMVLTGCGIRTDPELAAIEPEIDAAIARFGSGAWNPWSRYSEIFQSTTNRELRAKYSRLRRQKLLAVEIEGEDYAAQARVFDRVATGLYPNPASTTAWRWTIEDDCAAHIERLKWMRRQLDKWKSIVGRRADRLREEDPAKFRAWNAAYQRSLNQYECDSYLLEFRFSDMCKTLLATELERSRAKAMVEKHLEHPLRTKEELEKVKRLGVRSEEMKALSVLRW